MIKPPPPKATGIAGLVFLFCAVAAVAGVGFDLMNGGAGRLSIIAQPGARAVLGVGVAVAAILLAHALRFALGRKITHADEGGGEHGNHP
jgi:hypothetical protein